MNTLRQLQSRGVIFPAPDATYVADDVNPDRIAPGTIVHPGCRLSGAELAIGPDCVIGAEAPATVVNCQLGTKVHLAGGFFEQTTFLDGFKAGSCSHVRPGCLFEEESSIAHSVGVKQTVFLPWVTAGSLINFCDCLMAGGTGRKDHSEIGSSYIHFNFTPHQDKATASLIGDVPFGVLLNQPAIFLGGQGGLVGPCRIAFGTIIPAGQVWRYDVSEKGCLVAKPSIRNAIHMPYDPRQYHGVKRIVRNNLVYIGNIVALDMWYRVMRSPFMTSDPFKQACYIGARQRLATILDERLSRLDELAKKVSLSLSSAQPNTATGEQRDFVEHWPNIKDSLAARLAEHKTGTVPEKARSLADTLPKTDYLRAIRSITTDDASMLSDWLSQIVSAYVQHRLPSEE